MPSSSTAACRASASSVERSAAARRSWANSLGRSARSAKTSPSATPSATQRLQQLADNKIGRIQEQEELEERESALFGLPLKKLDEEGVEQAASPWLAPDQLARLVKRYLLDKGYERADTLFDRPVSLLRPEQGSARRRWPTTCGRSPQTAPRPGSAGWPAAPNSRAASPSTRARRTATTSNCCRRSTSWCVRRPRTRRGSPPETTVALRVESQGCARRACTRSSIHAWTYLGARDDFEVVVTSTDPSDLRPRSQASWSTRRTRPPPRRPRAQRTRRAPLLRRGRMRGPPTSTGRAPTSRASSPRSTTTHHARVELLEDQIAIASHDNIRRMRESELRSVEDDFATRASGSRRPSQRSDVTTTLLCSGSRRGRRWLSSTGFRRHCADSGSRYVESARRRTASRRACGRLLAELYPDNAHFIYELLQNAEDARATVVEFELDRRSLTVTPRRRRGRSRSPTSSRSPASASRPRRTTRPRSASSGSASRRCSPTPPAQRSARANTPSRSPTSSSQSSSTDGREQGAPPSRFPFDRARSQQTLARAEVERGLRELDEKTLLFLNSIGTITYALPDGTVGIIERKTIDESHNHDQKSEGDGFVESHWLRLVGPGQRPARRTRTRSPSPRRSGSKMKETAEADRGRRSATARAAERSAPDRSSHSTHGDVSIYFPAVKEVLGTAVPYPCTVCLDCRA